MKKILSLLALLIILKVNASAIGMGLNSPNIYAVNVWENNKGQLKHYLYIYNKSEKHVKIVIKQNLSLSIIYNTSKLLIRLYNI